MGNRRIVLSIAAAASLLALLAACSPAAPAPSESPSVVAGPSAPATPTSTPAREPALFVAPANCEQMLGAALIAEITSDGHVLFSSSDGTGIYYPNESQQQGGFQCQYGKDMVDLSTFELDAQALTQQAHEGVISILDAGGYTKTVEGDVVTYAQVGDEMGTQTYLHVVRPDSWITGWSSFGGDTQFAKISSYVATVGQQLYPTQ
ncbi:MAG: hypothetical protein JWP19_739 [Rhodoglobus sp.]|nr:hypothetical protein [Rhodoglobus sp.]